jgi:predicted aldo/keto reductase-like oxidoreductase
VQSYSAIPMEMIKVPHTDLEVSRLAMGCMGLGGGLGSGTQLAADHERQAREFLDAAEKIGANFFEGDEEDEYEMRNAKREAHRENARKRS